MKQNYDIIMTSLYTINIDIIMLIIYGKRYERTKWKIFLLINIGRTANQGVILKYQNRKLLSQEPSFLTSSNMLLRTTVKCYSWNHNESSKHVNLFVTDSYHDFLFL